MFTELCKNHHLQGEYLSSPFPSQALSTNSFPLSVDLPILNISLKYNHICSLLCLAFSKSPKFSRFITVIACVRISLHLTAIPYFIHTNLACFFALLFCRFYFATVNMLPLTVMYNYLFKSLLSVPRSNCSTGSYHNFMLTQLKVCLSFSIVAIPFNGLTQNCVGDIFFYVLVNAC